MGKKARKTRWRSLPISASGEHNSDSEESTTLSETQQIPKTYHHHQQQAKPFYSKFPYSSQSTPIRNRFQNDTKSTRSNSTTSENKITFNEDEYTRITTPRQDVLFKKGYLSKPKTYQTQTSTGNSTISTGNSTGNGTPDHQSADGTEGTDLEYESQFVFPGGFVDHNGIYYVNSYEPYPMVVYNAPYCYPEYPPTRSKRYSTDSLTESTSPHNEETSHSGGETVNTVPEHKDVYNVIYPGYYYNNGTVSVNTEIESNIETSTEPRKIKKRRRRKLSKPIPDGTSSSDEYESDEVVSEIENRIIHGTHHYTQNITQNTIDTSTHRAMTTEESDESNTPKQNGCEAILQNGRHVAEEIIPKTNGVEAIVPKTIDPKTNNMIDAKTIDVNLIKIDAKTNKAIDAKINGVINDDTKTNKSIEAKTIEAKINKANNNESKTIDVQTNGETVAKTNETKTNQTKTNEAKNNKSKTIETKTIEAKTNKTETIEAKTIKTETIEKIETKMDEAKTVDVKSNNVIDSKIIKPKIIEAIKTIEDKVEAATNEVKLIVDANDGKQIEASHDVKGVEASHDVKFSPIVENVDCIKSRISKTNLKADAKEFYPRTYHPIPLEQNPMQIINLSPNFCPMPFINELPPNFNPAFLPPGIPINFINFVPNHTYVPNQYNTYEAKPIVDAPPPKLEEIVDAPTPEIVKVVEAVEVQIVPEIVMVPKVVQEPLEAQFTRKPVDIEKIVSKLEEAAIEQNRRTTKVAPNKFAPKLRRFNQEQGNQRRSNWNKNAVIAAKCVEEEVIESPKKRYNNVVAKPVVNNVHINKEICSNYAKVVQKKVAPAQVVVASPSHTKDSSKLGPNQWISVSSRKKRKNKNAENNLEEFEEEVTPDADFEVYDLNKLEDVIIPIVKLEEIVLEPEAAPAPIVMQDVQEIEKVLIQESKDLDQLIKSLAEIEAKTNKNKNKKGSQKPRRIIITDADLSDKVVQSPKKTPLKIAKKIVTKVNSVIIEEISKEVVEAIPPKQIVNETIPPQDKKKKNKKKKTNKSNSSSTLTLNNLDETYDFLLDNTLLEDEKTNVEMSEELDKLIQKGMYSSLEEKIRSLNITAANDGFFKTISLGSSLKTSDKKLNHNADLGNILKNTTQLFKQKRHSFDEPIINLDYSKISLPDFAEAIASTSTNGSFLDVSPEVIDPGIKEAVTSDVQNGKRKKMVEKRAQSAPKESLHPITDAVKMWMSKTRETTPEVEILKSPSLIFKELHPKNANLNSQVDLLTVGVDLDDQDDEITLFSADTWSLTPESSIEEDLLDCWENDPVIELKQVALETPITPKIEKGEEAVEIYESKYGLNEDFLQLKKEVEEKKRNGTLPKHGNLPYKAICCSLQ